MKFDVRGSFQLLVLNTETLSEDAPSDMVNLMCGIKTMEQCLAQHMVGTYILNFSGCINLPHRPVKGETLDICDARVCFKVAELYSLLAGRGMSKMRLEAKEVFDVDDSVSCEESINCAYDHMVDIMQRVIWAGLNLEYFEFFPSKDGHQIKWWHQNLARKGYVPPCLEPGELASFALTADERRDLDESAANAQG